MSSKRQADPADRRQHPRGELAAFATFVTAQGSAGPFILENISAGGALVLGECPLAVGEPAKVLVQLPGRPALRVDGTVVRCTGRGGTRRFAIEFRDLSSKVRAELERFVLPVAGPPADGDSRAPKKKKATRS